jgi:hypothetical protein
MERIKELNRLIKYILKHHKPNLLDFPLMDKLILHYADELFIELNDREFNYVKWTVKSLLSKELILRSP